MKFGIGQSVRRSEDERFLTGKGLYVEDIADPHALHIVFVRSPVAHARIAGIDASAALTAPGVEAVLTGDDYLADGIGGLVCHTLFPGVHKDQAVSPATAIATDRVRYVGAPVAMILASSRAAARDAAELVEVDLEEMEPVVTTGQADLEPGVRGIGVEVIEQTAGAAHGNSDRTQQSCGQCGVLVTIAPAVVESRDGRSGGGALLVAYSLLTQLVMATTWSKAPCVPDVIDSATPRRKSPSRGSAMSRPISSRARCARAGTSAVVSDSENRLGGIGL